MKIIGAVRQGPVENGKLWHSVICFGSMGNYTRIERGFVDKRDAQREADQLVRALLKKEDDDARE